MVQDLRTYFILGVTTIKCSGVEKTLKLERPGHCCYSIIFKAFGI